MSRAAVASALGFAAILALASPAAGQSPPASSFELTKYGYERLAAGEPRPAFDAFTARLKADPRDGAAAFGRGVALNRAGRFVDAAKVFGAYEAAGGRNPSLDLEYAIALLRSGNAKEAIPRLERYRQVDAALRARTDLELGAAYAAEKRFADSERSLKRALASKEARPAALALLAGMERKRDKPGAAKAYLAELESEAPDSAAAKLLRDIADRQSKKQ